VSGESRGGTASKKRPKEKWGGNGRSAVLPDDAVSEGRVGGHGKQEKAEGEMGRKWSVGGPAGCLFFLFFRLFVCFLRLFVAELIVGSTL
jgi:hypothetical protein